MALALEMQSRGHHPVIATLPVYREKIEAAGLDFFPVRPDAPLPDTAEGKEMIRRAMDARDGPRYVIAELMAPYTRESYVDTVAAVKADGGADILVSHSIPMVAPIVAATTGVRWVSAVLAPISLFSVSDPPTPPQFPFLRSVLLSHPLVARSFISLVKRVTASWVKPVRELRKELGLPAGQHPVFEGQHSPRRVLALFSRVLARAQSDYPPNSVITGFPFYDRYDEQPAPVELARFLDDGEPPILFTLGSTAVHVGEEFFRTSIEVTRKLKRRGLLLAGDTLNPTSDYPYEGIAVFNYAQHSLVMPRSSVIVHQGGIGTTGQALRSGRPMLVVPHGQDQPDNARRCVELGVGRMLPRKLYTASRVIAALEELLKNGAYREQAEKAGLKVVAEDGTRKACDEIELEMAKDA